MRGLFFSVFKFKKKYFFFDVTCVCPRIVGFVTALYVFLCLFNNHLSYLLAYVFERNFFRDKIKKRIIFGRSIFSIFFENFSSATFISVFCRIVCRALYVLYRKWCAMEMQMEVFLFSYWTPKSYYITSFFPDFYSIAHSLNHDLASLTCITITSLLLCNIFGLITMSNRFRSFSAQMQEYESNSLFTEEEMKEHLQKQLEQYVFQIPDFLWR